MRFEVLKQMLQNNGVGGVQIMIRRHAIAAWKVSLVGEYLPLEWQRQAVGRTLIDALWALEEGAGGARRTAQEHEGVESLLLQVIRAANAEGVVRYDSRSGSFVGAFTLDSLTLESHRSTLLEAIMGAASALIRVIDARHCREYLS